MASVLVTESDQPGHRHKLCDACLRDDTSSTATKWCRDCKEALCEDPCYIAHKRSKATTKHCLISMKDVTEQEILASKLDIDTNCKHHQGKPLELYCRTHKSFCCSVCAFTNHQECKEMISLDDLSKRYSEKKILEQQRSVFAEILKQVQSFIEKKSSYLQSLDKDKSSILTNTSDMVKRAKTKLDKLYSDFEKVVIKEHKTIKEPQERTMESVLECQSKIQETSDTIETLCHVSANESLIMMETIKSDALEHCQQFERVLQQDTYPRIQFKPSPTIQSLLNDLLSFGDVFLESCSAESSLDMSSIQEAIHRLDIGTMIGTTAQIPVRPKKDLMVAKVEFVQVVPVTGVCRPRLLHCKFTDKDELLLVDYNNKRLILFDNEMKSKREIRVNGEPTCLDLSEDEKIVHVVCDGNSVHQYSLNDGMEVAKRMAVGNEAWGKAVIGENTIISYNNNKIVLYDVHGNTIKSVTANQVDPFLAVSSSREQIYYHNGDTVIACDKSLNEKWRYKCPNLYNPSGIDVDFYGNVYVVERGYKNIHQISSDGSSHRILVQGFKNILSPLCIAFNKHKDTFAVTSTYPQDAQFEVYKLLS